VTESNKNSKSLSWNGKGMNIFLKSGKPRHFNIYSVYGLICSIIETKRSLHFSKIHDQPFFLFMLLVMYSWIAFHSFLTCFFLREMWADTHHCSLYYMVQLFEATFGESIITILCKNRNKTKCTFLYNRNIYAHVYYSKTVCS